MLETYAIAPVTSRIRIARLIRLCFENVVRGKVAVAAVILSVFELRVEPDGLALRGQPGGAAVNVVQKFVSEKPLDNIVIKLTGWHNARNLGGSFSLGVSLDGKNVSTDHYRVIFKPEVIVPDVDRP